MLTILVKRIYFDEVAARDYIDIANGGLVDWSTDEQMEKIAEIIAGYNGKIEVNFILKLVV